MKATNVVKGFFTMLFSIASSILGILTIPVILMVLCNIIDYATGLLACPKREEKISSYRSMKGIAKKITMWLLVAVGAIIDCLLKYASETAGFTLPFTFFIACIVAIWIICNEIISILENMIDIGITIPSFLEPLIKNIKSQVEDKVKFETKDLEDDQ